MTERVHGGGTARSGDFEPIEVRPAGDPFDPNEEALAPINWTGDGDILGAADLNDEARVDAGEPPVWVPPVPALSAGEVPRRPKWRFLPRTLAGRLVTGVVALVIIVVAAAGGATYGLLGSFLTSRLDQQVDNAFGGYQRATAQCISVGACKFEAGAVPGGQATSTSVAIARNEQRVWFAVLLPDGSQLPISSSSVETAAASLTSQQRAALAASPGKHLALTVDGTSIRATSRAVLVTSAGTYYEVIGLSSDEVTNTLNRLLLLELYIGVGAVLVALLATAFGVRLSLRPLHRVTNTARAVTAELSPEGAGLDRRVDVTEPESEVGQLAESVNTLLGAVGTQFAARVESERRMRQFMADASHELRTPLTSIRGYAELARMQRAFDDTTEDAPPSRASDTEALTRIEHEGTRMSRLVDDLLTLARGDTGSPVESVPLDIAEVVDDAVDGVRAAHPDRPYEVTAADGLSVYGDHDQLVRVIRNLVNNAAVHTRAGAPIRVRATREGANVVIRVIDSGPGLTPEQAAHVFERFWRSDGSRARSSGGSGLGLAIVASIVGAHNGTVRFDSTVESGSVVTVSLPAG